MDNDNQLCKSGQCVVGDVLKSCHIRSLRAPLKMPLSHHTEQGHRQGSDDGHAALFDGHEFKSWSIFCENHIVANTFTPWTLLYFIGNCPSAVLVHADYCIYLKMTARTTCWQWTLDKGHFLVWPSSQVVAHTQMALMDRLCSPVVPDGCRRI